MTTTRYYLDLASRNIMGRPSLHDTREEALAEAARILCGEPATYDVDGEDCTLLYATEAALAADEHGGGEDGSIRAVEE